MGARGDTKPWIAGNRTSRRIWMSVDMKERRDQVATDKWDPK